MTAVLGGTSPKECQSLLGDTSTDTVPLSPSSPVTTHLQLLSLLRLQSINYHSPSLTTTKLLQLPHLLQLLFSYKTHPPPRTTTKPLQLLPTISYNDRPPPLTKIHLLHLRSPTTITLFHLQQPTSYHYYSPTTIAFVQLLSLLHLPSDLLHHPPPPQTINLLHLLFSYNNQPSTPTVLLQLSSPYNNEPFHNKPPPTGTVLLQLLYSYNYHPPHLRLLSFLPGIDETTSPLIT